MKASAIRRSCNDNSLPTCVSPNLTSVAAVTSPAHGCCPCARRISGAPSCSTLPTPSSHSPTPWPRRLRSSTRPVRCGYQGWVKRLVVLGCMLSVGIHICEFLEGGGGVKYVCLLRLCSGDELRCFPAAATSLRVDRMWAVRGCACGYRLL